jgi:hypothetical protein
VAVSGGSGGRFYVSGIVAEGLGEDLVDGQRVYARGSIRRLASISSETEFAFVAYSNVPDGVAAFDVELTQGDTTLYEASLPIRWISESTGANDDYLNSARRAYAEHQYEQSAMYFALSEEAGTGSDIVDFAESLIAIGLYDEAEWRLDRWFAAEPSDSKSGFVVDLLCSEIARSRLPGWRRNVEKVLSTQANSNSEASILANRGHAHVADGDLRSAVAFYSEASRRNAGRPLIHFARGIHTAQLALEVDQPRKGLRMTRGKPAADIVHLFACDGGYFKRFAAKLAKSSAESRGNEQVIIHAHVVDGDDECRQLANRLEQSYGLRVSWESTPAGIKNLNVQRAYFTCARFLAAPAILEQYRCPVLITETDCLINWTWSDVLRYSAGSDFGYLQSALTNWVPWTKIPAGVVLFGPTESGIACSRYVASFIEQAFERFGSGSADLWTVDQVALWLAHMNAPRSCRQVNLPMSSLLTLATGDKLNI